MGGRRVCQRRAGDGGHQVRHHRADRLLADRHRPRARVFQEVRHRVDRLEGSVVGGDPRQAVARREPGHAHADRHAAGVDHGAGGVAGEADGDSVAAQPERSGDHAEQQAEGGRREDASPDQTHRREGQGRRRSAHVRDDVPARHARDVGSLLARLRRDPSGPGRQPHHDPAGADGREHEGRQDGRLLRRRAVEQPRHRRRHRVHGRHHAAAVERPPGEGLRVHRGVRAEESAHRQGDPEGAASRQRRSGQAREPPEVRGDHRPARLHQLPARHDSRAAARQVHLRRRPGRTGSELHDLLEPGLQLPAPDLREMVADPVPALGHGEGGAGLRGHPEAGPARRPLSRGDEGAGRRPRRSPRNRR